MRAVNDGVAYFDWFTRNEAAQKGGNETGLAPISATDQGWKMHDCYSSTRFSEERLREGETALFGGKVAGAS